jgi:hypothetical protein
MTLATAVAAQDVWLPPPVEAYADELDQECRASGLGEIITTDIYAENADAEDMNGDGKPDYLVYKCMFGCSKKPDAFLGIGTPCPHGRLLLSRPDGYERVFLPGIVTKVHTDSGLRVAIQRPRSLRLVGNFCKDPFPDYTPSYVYHYKEGRFQLISMCPPEGCKTVLDSTDVKSAQ